MSNNTFPDMTITWHSVDKLPPKIKDCVRESEKLIICLYVNGKPSSMCYGRYSFTKGEYLDRGLYALNGVAYWAHIDVSKFPTGRE